jgi:hypothetical protein
MAKNNPLAESITTQPWLDLAASGENEGAVWTAEFLNF